jgi:hypothetical protein
MKSFFRLGIGVLALAALGFAATKPTTEMSGNYVEARTADVYTGPCFANSEVQQVGNLAVFGWKVKQGIWQGVNLDGLGVVAAIKANSTLGDRFGNNTYPVKAVVIVDERASLEQRQALVSFAKRMSNDLLQDVERIDVMPIEFTLAGDNVHSAAATLSAGTLARIQTRAINNGDHVCSNEEVWYDPLTTVEHAMPAVALDHQFKGQGLNATWSSPDKRSAFVGTFHLAE